MLSILLVMLYKLTKILVIWFQLFGLSSYKKINGIQDIMVSMENGLPILVRELTLQKTLVLKLSILLSKTHQLVLNPHHGHLLTIL